MAKRIAILGKGGTGKTTIAANLCASLAEAGHSVMLVGCSPTTDSSMFLHSDPRLVTLHDYLQMAERPLKSSLVAIGYRGVACIETGDFTTDETCATRFIAKALDLLHELQIVQEMAPDFVIYDLPGDIGCLGSELMSRLPITTALVVTTTDVQSMIAANRFIGGLTRQLAGITVSLVANGIVSSFENSLVTDFAQQVATPLCAAIPRSLVVRQCELYGRTVIESAPHSTHAYAYRRLAKQLGEGGHSRYTGNPHTLSTWDLKQWAMEWGERLGELEFGHLQDGAGI